MNRLYLAGILITAAALAQSPEPAFEVATIKLAAPSQSGHDISWGRGLMHLNNVTLDAAIRFAYHLHVYQLSGGPKWADSRAFDIVGKADSPETKPPIMRAMLRTLLAERFQLTLRKETKPLPAFALVIAKGGLKLERASPGDTQNRTSRSGPMMLEVHGMPLAGIADLIAHQVGRPVVDNTKAAGFYNLTMHFARENAAPDTDDPSFFTALQEQCGLKLESTTAPGDTFVIESAELPSPN